MNTHTTHTTCVFIPVYGDVQELDIPTDTAASLAALQELVGGYLESVYTGDTVVMLVNEDGIAKNLPANLRASTLASTHIKGNAVLLGAADDDGNTTAATMKDWRALAAQRGIE